MTQFKLLSFDLDDTLWSLRPVLIRAEQTLHDWLTSRYPDLTEQWTPEKLFALRRSLLDQRPELTHQISTLRIVAIETVLTEHGLSSTEASRVSSEAFEVFLAARHEVELFDDVEDCLGELSQRFRLAAITNGNADVFKLSLGDYFSFAIRAEQHGVSKPDPALFREALRRGEVTAAQMIHIGDHVEQDVVAAQQAGIVAIWANINQQDWPGLHPPDAEIRHFRELPAVIAQLSR